jgi:outer membrane receptor for ferrienterochelin and colicins
MKSYIKLFVFALFTVLSSSIYAQSDSTSTFEVAGNCGMCKKRIEKAATLSGVESAIWNVENHG